MANTPHTRHVHHRSTSPTRFSALCLAATVVLGGTAYSASPGDSAPADWEGFEEGVRLLGEGFPRRAAQAFREWDEPRLEPLPAVSHYLAVAYSHYRGDDRRPELDPFLEEAEDLARARKIPATVYQEAIQRVRKRLRAVGFGHPPFVRVLLCHLKHLSGIRAEVAEPRHIGGEVEHPRRIFTPHPDYSDSARKARINGVVIVQAIIDSEGCMCAFKVLKGLSHGLNETTLEAHYWWTYHPAELRGEPIPVYLNTTTTFRI